MATTGSRDTSGVWDRRRLLLTLAGVASAAVLLVAGLVCVRARCPTIDRAGAGGW